MAKLLTEELALYLTQKLLNNDKLIKEELEAIINSVDTEIENKVVEIIDENIKDIESNDIDNLF